MMKKAISILILTFMICGLLISCGEAAGGEKQENPPENSGGSQNPGSENKPSDEENTEKEPTVGNQVGNLAPTMDIERLGGGSVNTEDYRGKVVVINFWGTWCPYCLIELPDFSRVAAEYENVVVIAVHSYDGRNTVADYVSTNFPESDIIFAYDIATEGYYFSLGGTGGYPRTLVLNAEGVITYARAGMIDYDYLASLVESAGAGK